MKNHRLYALGVAALVVTAVVTLFMILGTGDQPLMDDSMPAVDVVDIEEPAVEIAVEKVPPPAASPEPAEEIVDAELVEEPEIPDPEEPSLRGFVSGEAGPIVDARVLLFSFRLVTELVKRFQRFGSNPSPTDIPRIINVVKTEFARLRDSALEARSAEEGRYAFYRLAPGSYFVLVIADGHVFDFGDVVATEKDRTTEHHVSMSKGESVTGRVVDAEGDPVAGATVLAVFRPPGLANIGKIVQKLLQYINGEFLRGPFEETTDSDGRFELDSLPPGVYDLFAEAPDFPDASLESVLSGTTEAVVVLRPGKQIVGKLVDTRGASVANTQIRLGAERPPIFLPIPGGAEMVKTVERIVADPDRFVITAADGEFRLADVASGRYVLEIDVTGYLLLRRSVQVQDEEPDNTLDLGEIRIDTGQTIEGVVRDDYGGGVARASVAVFQQRDNFKGMGSTIRDIVSGRNSVESDESGKFVVAGLGVGKYAVVAQASGHGRAVEREVAAGSQAIELVLRRGVDIEGEVREEDTDEPLKEIDVYCSGTQTKTDADGRFRLEGVAPRGRFDPFVSAKIRRRFTQADGEPSIEVRFSSAEYESKGESIPLSEVNREFKITLKRRPSIEGRVLDPDGEPLVGALLRLVPGDSDQPFLSSGMIFVDASISRLEGDFGLKPVDSSGSYFVLASHPLYATTPGTKFRVENGKVNDDIEIQMVRAARVYGKVSDGTTAVVGVTLQLSPAREKSATEVMFTRILGMPEEGATTFSNSEGKFRFERVLPGDYSITARTRGYGETRRENVAIAEGEEREINVELDPGGEIAGSVLTSDGEGLPGARLRVLRANQSLLGDDDLKNQKLFGGHFKATQSQDDGSFEFEGLPDGEYVLIAERRGFVTQEIASVTPGEDATIEIVLEESARLSGDVVNAATGAPLTEYDLKLVEIGADEPTDFLFGKRRRLIQDSSGRFVEKDLAPGQYTLSIKAIGYLPIEEEISLRPGEQREVRMLLRRAGHLEGTVVDAQTGNAIGDVAVRISPTQAAPEDDELDALHARLLNNPKEILHEHWGGRDDVHSTPHGEIDVENFPEGEQTVVFAHSGYVPERRPGVKIEAGESTTLDVVLRRGLEIVGTLRYADGRPVGNAIVVARGTAAGNLHVRQSTRPSEDGAFQVRGLLGGRYVVAARSRKFDEDDNTVGLEVELIGGGIEGLEITIGK